jgi:gamma-glutamyltranspeptidase/glutathione hydrolase
VRAGSSTPEALLAIGGAPAGLAEHARSVGSGGWRDVGPHSVGPPGAPHGYAALAALGVLGLERLAAPAVALASNGFPWATVCTRLGEQAAALVREMNPDGCAYYPGGRPIDPDTVVRLPGLVDVLDEFVRRGSSLMDGPVGDAVVEAVTRRGGVLDRGDFAHARAEWAACAAGAMASTSGDVDVWTTPAPTHGVSLLDAISGFAADGRTPVQIFESVLRAIRTSRATLADPSGTSMVSAGDAAGNAVVVVHSNSYPRFGSGIVVEGFDLVLANRAGRGFTAQPGHPNFPVAGRRPATTLHAWAVAGADGRPRFMGATPGGANQMPWNAQTLARLSAGEDDPGTLVTSPIWEWLPDDDGVRIEGGFSPDEAESLRAAAPRTIVAPRWGCKSAQQVLRIPRGHEPWVGAADPRTVGLALGV